jgi:hypothetical protein
LHVSLVHSFRQIELTEAYPSGHVEQVSTPPVPSVSTQFPPLQLASLEHAPLELD